MTGENPQSVSEIQELDARIHVELTRLPLAIDAAVALLPADVQRGCGAVCTFQGVTRDWCDGKQNFCRFSL